MILHEEPLVALIPATADPDPDLPPDKLSGSIGPMLYTNHQRI